MTLPTPSPEKVREFATIYYQQFGVVLSESEALEAATLTLQLFYLGTYGLKTKVQSPPARDESSDSTRL
jgi:hypothetical protein